MDEVLQNPSATIAATIFYYTDGTGIPGNPAWHAFGAKVSDFGTDGLGLTNYMGNGGVFGTLAGSWSGLKINQYKGPMLAITKAGADIVTLEALTAGDERQQHAHGG